MTSSTNKTNLNREYKHARGECKEEDGVRSGVSPALVARQKQKHVKYGPLMAKIVKVRADDSQPIPKFYAAAVTTHGEFSSDFLELIERIVGAYKSGLVRLGERDDGVMPEFLAATFRNDFRANIMCALVRGTAMMIQAAGLSRLTCRKYR